MENIIYNELKIRGYVVDVGVVEVRKLNENKLDYKQLEIDFICSNGSEKYYIQSAYAIPDKMKEEQETLSFLHVKDSFKKIVIVKENIMTWRNEQGIVFMSIKDFLLDKDSLKI